MKKYARLIFILIVIVFICGCSGTPVQSAIVGPQLTATPDVPTATPAPTPAPHPAVKDVAAGYHCFFILCEGGSVWAWGKNQYGQLGDGTTEDSWKFVKILDDVKKITPYFAIKNDDSLWVWGNGDFSTHRNGSTLWSWGGDSPAPRQIMTDVKDANMSLILKTDGTLWDWKGWHSTFSGMEVMGSGEWLGDIGNSTLAAGYDKKIMDGIESIPQTDGQTFIAIKIDGSLWLWGDTGLQKYPKNVTADPLKTETEMEHSPSLLYEATTLLKPEKILDGGVQSAVILDGGLRSRIVALKTDGTLLEWGEGIVNGGNAAVPKFPEISVYPTPYSVSRIAGYGSIFYTVTGDGNLYGFKYLEGYGGGIGYVPLGDLPLETDVKTVAVGPDNETLVLKQDGSVYKIGYKYDTVQGTPTLSPYMMPETDWAAGISPAPIFDSFGAYKELADKQEVETKNIQVYPVSVNGVQYEMFVYSDGMMNLTPNCEGSSKYYWNVLYLNYDRAVDAFSGNVIGYTFIYGGSVKVNEDFFPPDSEVSLSDAGLSLAEYIQDYSADKSIVVPETCTVAELEDFYNKIVASYLKYYAPPEPFANRPDSLIPR